MVIFHSYVSLPEGTFLKNPSDLAPKKTKKKRPCLVLVIRHLLRLRGHAAQ